MLYNASWTGAYEPERVRVVRKFRPEGRRHVRMNPDREREARVRTEPEARPRIIGRG